MTGPAQIFTRVGHALYGDEFVAPIAMRLGVPRNTVGKWAAGKSRVPPGVWLDLAGLIQDREETLAGLKVAVLALADPQ